MKPFSVSTAGQAVPLSMPMSAVVQLHVQYFSVGTERLPINLRAIASSVKIDANFFELDDAFLETKTLNPYKTNDRVTIVSNSLQPQYKGKVGKIKKVYASFSENDVDEHEFFYRVEVDNTVLKGFARDSDLQPA